MYSVQRCCGLVCPFPVSPTSGLLSPHRVLPTRSSMHWHPPLNGTQLPLPTVGCPFCLSLFYLKSLSFISPFLSSELFRPLNMSQDLRKVFGDIKKFIGTKKYKEADPEALKKHLDDAFNAIGTSFSDPATQASVKR